MPVFFTGDLSKNATDPDFSFGLTRLYRIPHRYSVGDLLARSSKAHIPARVENGELTLKPDFVEHLFGYVYEPKELEFGQSILDAAPPKNAPSTIARKGRLAFGFATPKNGDFTHWPPKNEPPIETIMGAPKPSYAPFYLVGESKDYSDDNHARLAGRKRYIARQRQGDADPRAALGTALRAQIPKPKPGEKTIDRRALASEVSGPAERRGGICRADKGAQPVGGRNLARCSGR